MREGQSKERAWPLLAQPGRVEREDGPCNLRVSTSLPEGERLPARDSLGSCVLWETRLYRGWCGPPPPPFPRPAICRPRLRTWEPSPRFDKSIEGAGEGPYPLTTTNGRERAGPAWPVICCPRAITGNPGNRYNRSRDVWPRSRPQLLDGGYGGYRG